MLLAQLALFFSTIFTHNFPYIDIIHPYLANFCLAFKKSIHIDYQQLFLEPRCGKSIGKCIECD